MRQTSPAWSFRGRSHDKIKKAVPGPGTYSPTMVSKEFSPSYRIGTSNRLTSEIKFAAPGPGEYSPKKQFLSSPNTVFSKAKRSEVNQVTSNPGPGSYNPKGQEFSPQYKIPLANSIIIENKTPGPGRYSPCAVKGEPLYSVPKARRNSLYVESSEIPGPGTYDAEGSFTQGIKYSMGKAGRYSNKRHSNPGPGTYTANSVSQPSTPKYTMNCRRKSELKDTGPGPGAYSPTFQETTIKFSVSKSDHQKLKITENPGPGSYDISKKLVSGSTIGKSQRPPLSQVIETPGPGSYNLPSVDKNLAFSISARRKLRTVDCDPGPGQYTPNMIKQSAPAWRLGTESKRLQFKDYQVPGPGSYTSPGTNSNQTYSFCKTNTQVKGRRTGPGPGSYEIKSSIGELPSYANNNKAS